MDKNFRKIMEDKLLELQNVDWRDAPFPLDVYEAKIWNEGRLVLMNWVIEMMPKEETNDIG